MNEITELQYNLLIRMDEELNENDYKSLETNSYNLMRCGWQGKYRQGEGSCSFNQIRKHKSILRDSKVAYRIVPFTHIGKIETICHTLNHPYPNP